MNNLHNTKTEPPAGRKRLEKRVPRWCITAALYLSFIAGTYFDAGITVQDIVGQVTAVTGVSVSYGFTVLLRLLVPAVSTLLFEVFARAFCMLSNAMTGGALNMRHGDFAAALSLFIIPANLFLGVWNVLFYFYNILIPLKAVLAFAAQTAACLLFFRYINKHVLNPLYAHRVFRVMALLYFAYAFFTTAGGILL